MNRKKYVPIVLFILLISFFCVNAGLGTIDQDAALSRLSFSHPFGTDTFGRDLLERVSLGALISIALSFFITVISTALGVLLAFLMASNAATSAVSFTISGIMKSLSSILLALFLSSIFGPGFLVLIVSISLSHIPNIAQTAYSRILVIKKEDFILYSKTLGMNRAEIAVFHIIPHLKDEVLQQSLSIFSSSILTEASLSFLGAGIPITYPSLGSIMADGRALIISSPHLIIIPSIVLFIISLLLYLEREALDLDS